MRYSLTRRFMGLFSVLFGAGIALFCDRAAQKTRRPASLSLWRNLLLLGIGILHLLLWEGDILIGYALVSPLIILFRNRCPRTLFLLAGQRCCCRQWPLSSSKPPLRATEAAWEHFGAPPRR